MKKLFGILLMLVLAIAIALPALAAEEAPDFKVVNTNINATALKSYTVKDEIYDEETKEIIGYGPEWTHYDWTKYTFVEVVYQGETYNVTVDQLGVFYADRYGWNYGGGIMDGQSAETPWEVGGTYDVYYYVFDHKATEGDGIVWDVNLKVTLTATEAKVQISDITIDELSGWTMEGQDGSSYKYYDILSHGIVDVTVGDTVYEDTTLEILNMRLREEYGEIYYSYNFIYEGDQYPGDQDSNPWKPGDTFRLELGMRSETEYLFAGEVTVTVHETNIDHITAKPVTVYSHRRGAALVLTNHYKDGTTGPCRLNEWDMEPIPEEPGTYTVKILVAGTFEVPLEVTVLPAPTSGKLGENVNWAYDATTKTLTISGTGDTYFVGMNAENATEEYDEWYYDWEALMSYYLPKNVVVEEGITGLMPTFLIYAPAVEELSLPNSLKNLPLGLIGYNGPSTDVDLGLDYETKGLSTFIVPRSIKAWDELAFYQCWGIKDIYLPAGLTSVNLENLIYTAWVRNMIGAEAIDVTVHFAGTEAQWNAINFFVPEVDPDFGSALATGLTLEEAKELLKTVKIVFDDPSETYKDEIVVENGTVTVPDDIVEIEEGKDIVIDITIPNTGDGETAPEAPKVESVVIGSATVDKIVNAETKVEIKLPEVTVSFDKAAIGSIGEQAADKDVTIVATEVKQEDLKTEQKAALEEKQVFTVLNLEAKAGDEKITEFGGGKVTISVEFELPEGTIGTDFVVAYVADDGTITLMPTTYANGVLSFETTHFSNYVVLAVSDNPKTGDTTVNTLVALLVLSGAACVALCANKRRVF